MKSCTLMVPKLNPIEKFSGRSTLARRIIQTGQIKVQTGQIKDLLDALGHLFGRLVGERHRQNLVRWDPATPEFISQKLSKWF